MCIFVHIYIVFACFIKTVSLNTTFAVSLGCYHDDVRAEPESWLVVGMIPVFDKKKAARTAVWPAWNCMPPHCPDAPVPQPGSALLEGWNVLSAVTRFCSGLMEPGVEPAS